MQRTLLTCTCLGTQKIDSEALSVATGQRVRKPCNALCTDDIDVAAKAMKEPGTVVCCAQESRTFLAVADELGVSPPEFLDLRDRAGWTSDSATTLPKMAALVAVGTQPAPPTRLRDIESGGLCLVLGLPGVALEAAERLKDYLGVTVLLDFDLGLDSPDGTDTRQETQGAPEIPATRDFDVIGGRVRQATGALGGFDVVIDGFREVVPGGRGSLSLGPRRDGAKSRCDVILDLRGPAFSPLFPAPDKREGYLRADPGRAQAVADAILEASHLGGVFEKPLHVRTEPHLCAHSRAEQTGCERCLGVCPTGAITPSGEHVAVNHDICAGCGACSAVCPSGAIAFDAPPVHATFLHVQTLAQAFLAAGGVSPRLVVHDSHGAEMIRLAARHGRGLPADAVPMELPAVNAFGHAEAVAALAAGFASVTLVPGPGADRAALAAQVELARAIGGDAIHVLDVPDPDEMADALHAETPPATIREPVRPAGSRRQIVRQAAQALRPDDESIPLPAGAPYGAVLADTDACTLCLSCVSLCPSGALVDNPDKPELRFQEDACLQCGLCAEICPEDAISYEPRLNLADSALAQAILHAEEPFACVECGAEFGVKSTIERVAEKLETHSAFAGDRARMIRMCDSCRVNAQFHSSENPFAAGPRPKPRTTDDYLH